MRRVWVAGFPGRIVGVSSTSAHPFLIEVIFDQDHFEKVRRYAPDDPRIEYAAGPEPDVAPYLVRWIVKPAGIEWGDVPNLIPLVTRLRMNARYRGFSKMEDLGLAKRSDLLEYRAIPFKSWLKRKLAGEI